MKSCKKKVTHSPQRGNRQDMLYVWSDEEGGSHLSDQSYYNRSDNPAPSCMAGKVVLYQNRCKEKHLLVKGKQ